MTNKYQSVYPPSMARVLIYLSSDSLEAVDGTCDQQDSDQTARSHNSYCSFCCALAQFNLFITLSGIQSKNTKKKKQKKKLCFFQCDVSKNCSMSENCVNLDQMPHPVTSDLRSILQHST